MVQAPHPTHRPRRSPNDPPSTNRHPTPYTPHPAPNPALRLWIRPRCWNSWATLVGHAPTTKLTFWTLLASWRPPPSPHPLPVAIMNASTSAIRRLIEGHSCERLPHMILWWLMEAKVRRMAISGGLRHQSFPFPKVFLVFPNCAPFESVCL